VVDVGRRIQSGGQAVKILALVPYLPSPPTFGGQRRLQGLLKYLALGNDLSLLSLHNPSDDQAAWTLATRQWCKDVAVFPQAAFGLRGARKRVAQLGTLLSPKSWDLISHRSEPLVSALREKLAATKFDVLLVEFAQMTANLRGVPQPLLPPVVLDEHNIEFDLQKRTAKTAAGAVRRVFAEANWRKLHGEEVAAWKQAAGISVTSTRDASLLREEVPRARCVVAPNGVDLDEFSPPRTPPDPDAVVFFGAHNYFPNTDALRFFLAEIWPRVIAARPSSRLRVVGPPPPSDVQMGAHESVVFTGFVPDLVAEVGRAAVAIAPLRIGGGTRLKVVEAMALARPLVATRIGAEGLEVEDGRDLLLADTPSDFAAALLRLLNDPREAAELGLRGRRRVEEAYGWSACARVLEDLCREAAGLRASPAAGDTPGPSRKP
jgi:glycosyltransferase involved in cell wall biosynthesis